MDPLEADLYAAICREPDLAAYHALADYYRERGLDAAADGVLRAADGNWRRPFWPHGGRWVWAKPRDPSRSSLSTFRGFGLEQIRRFDTLADAWAFLLKPDTGI